MPASISEDTFGQTKDGSDVTRYTLRSNSGRLQVRILNYGGIITEINVPDRSGKVADVNLGFDDMAGYESSSPYFGAIIGRVANRIAGGRFVLDGKTYQLTVNRPPNNLHGGDIGFDKKIWASQVDGDRLVLRYVSPDGEENFPGELTTTVVYSVTDNDELRLDYQATTTKPTPINLTNHAYFNLGGHGAGTLDDHVATIFADAFLPADENNIPTGEIKNVQGSEWDLRNPVRLGDRLQQVPGGKGFDNTFALPPNPSGKLALAARVDHPPSGRYLEVLTTEPGMQFYTSFYLNVPSGKSGAVYRQFGAFCLEAQHFPNSINTPSFPNTVLKPGETYRQSTVYKFGVA